MSEKQLLQKNMLLRKVKKEIVNTWSILNEKPKILILSEPLYEVIKDAYTWDYPPLTMTRILEDSSIEEVTILEKMYGFYIILNDSKEYTVEAV